MLSRERPAASVPSSELPWTANPLPYFATKGDDSTSPQMNEPVAENVFPCRPNSALCAGGTDGGSQAEELFACAGRRGIWVEFRFACCIQIAASGAGLRAVKRACLCGAWARVETGPLHQTMANETLAPKIRGVPERICPAAAQGDTTDNRSGAEAYLSRSRSRGHIIAPQHRGL